MSPKPESSRPLLGFVIALIGMLVVGLALFVPLFLWLPAYSSWRYLVWVAAFFGPLLGGEIGARLARQLGHPPYQQSLQPAAFAVILVLGLISVLPFLTRT